MHHNNGLFNGRWSDMVIETTYMRYGHGQIGINGITLKPENCLNLGIELGCIQQHRDRIE